MKKYILIFLLLLSSKIGLSQIRYDLNNEQQIAISYTNPKVYEVAEIEVIGEKYLDEVALKSLAGIKVGDNISIPGEAISGAIKKLWKQGIIGDIKIVINKIPLKPNSPKESLIDNSLEDKYPKPTIENNIIKYPK